MVHRQGKMDESFSEGRDHRRFFKGFEKRANWKEKCTMKSALFFLSKIN
jgi:hypothetical protein